jgi:ubiquinone/menaquinone biosynthesis C-methylase UbiE
VAELNFGERTANNYDEVFGRVSAHFVPFLLRAGRVSPGERVPDIACGTGLASEAALTVVGPSGSVTAADLSPEMVEQAGARLRRAPNASVRIEDGQALSFADESFDVVLYSLGLMFFPAPERGLSEFRRVLRPGGRAAVSVSTVPELSSKDVFTPPSVGTCRLSRRSPTGCSRSATKGSCGRCSKVLGLGTSRSRQSKGRSR